MNYHGYYEEFRHTYGPNFVEYIKEWKKPGKKKQRNFSFNCKTSNVYPQHILNTGYINIRCFSKNVQTKLQKSIQLFSKKILENEITDIIQEIQYMQKQISILKRNIILKK